MWKRVLFVSNIALVAGLAAILVGQVGASGAGVQYVNLAAPAFMGHDTSVHNGGTGTDACAAPVPLAIGDENKGDLQNATGSFIGFVRLADAGTVTGLSLFANDNDGDFNASVYLIRKRITNGLSPAKGGYSVMAQASSSGAVPDTLRKFSDVTINNAVVDNSKYMYYVELVNCFTAVEPFAVQVAVTT